MKTKVLAIVGSYRKNRVIDTAVSQLLDGAKQNGAIVKKTYLMDKKIAFCTNCRKCTQDPLDKKIGTCIHKDAMGTILRDIENADVIVIGSPINFFTVTAIMKKFVERTLVLSYWPWGKTTPMKRLQKGDKKAVVITSSAAPKFFTKLFVSNGIKILKSVCELFGAKVVKSFHFGSCCLNEDTQLDELDGLKMYSFGKKLTPKFKKKINRKQGPKVYIGNIHYAVTARNIRELFDKTSVTPQRVMIVKDRETGRPKGFGFAEFKSDKEVKEAVKILDGQVIRGRKIKANPAHKK